MPPDNNNAGDDDKSRVKLLGLRVELPPGEFEQALKALKKILDDKNFQKEIEKVFQAESRKLLKQEYRRQLNGSITLSDQESGSRLLSGSQKAFKSLAEREFRKSHSGRQFKKDLDRLSADFNKSPVGVWIDKHTFVAYIVGAVAIVGGVYGVYKTKEDIMGAPLELIDIEKKIGGIVIKGEVVSFKPGSGQYGANVSLGHTLQKVKYDLKLGGQVSKNGDFSQTTTGKVIVKINKQFKLTTSAKSVYSRKTETSTRMVAGFTENTEQQRDRLTADAAVGVEYDNNGYKFTALGYLKGINIHSTHPGTDTLTSGASLKATIPVKRGILNGNVSIEGKLEHTRESGMQGSIIGGLVFEL